LLCINADSARTTNNKIDVAGEFPKRSNPVIIRRGNAGHASTPKSFQPSHSGDLDECQQR
jgi:hypothetical protein